MVMRTLDLLSGLMILFQRVLIPHNILALLAGDEGIKVAVLIHVHKPNVVGTLIVVDYMGFEFSFAVILKPCGLTA